MLKLPDKAYDALKYLCVIILPALSALYSKLAVTWGWSYAEQIPETISAIEFFLGAAICISSAEYNKRIGGGTGHDA